MNLFFFGETGSWVLITMGILDYLKAKDITEYRKERRNLEKEVNTILKENNQPEPDSIITKLTNFSGDLGSYMGRYIPFIPEGLSASSFFHGEFESGLYTLLAAELIRILEYNYTANKRENPLFLACKILVKEKNTQKNLEN